MVAAAATAAFVSLLALAPTASAASLVQISNFGANPTNLGFFEYVPNSVTAHPAILVAVHFCTGSGPVFFSNTEFASLADRFGFIVIYPSATRSGSCFDVSSPGALTHNGNSDPVGIVSMVQWAEQHSNGDPSRVFVTGASSGGMMTNVLLGDYPDVFKAGAAFMGVPFGCFATTDGSLWNSACANGQISHTPQQWGDMARGADPGFTGQRPKMQLWHGTADTTLNFNNFGEEIKQWTNVLGVSQTPSSTSTPQAGWTHTTYGAANNPLVDAYSIAGAGHVLPQTGMAAIAIHFFGLDGSNSPPPTSPPPSTNPPPSSAPPSSPPPSSPPPGGGCSVANSVSAWNTGLTDNLTVTNNGSAAINGWNLKFTLASGQMITQAWNATVTPTSGTVTATNLSYNAAIPAGGNITFGFQANHTGNAAAPTGFTLNGVACTSS
jgi:poly(hydroxyalkanoate) depolymerase family esterase